jgi:hypothetical protein
MHAGGPRRQVRAAATWEFVRLLACQRQASEGFVVKLLKLVVVAEAVKHLPPCWLLFAAVIL